MECYVAYLLGEDEDGPHELSIDMFPEDGHIRVGEDGVTPFTEDAPLRNRKFADSPLEERVRCELVSEMGFGNSRSTPTSAAERSGVTPGGPGSYKKFGINPVHRGFARW